MILNRCIIADMERREVMVKVKEKVSTKKYENVFVRMPPQLQELIDRDVKKSLDGLTASSIVRRALVQYYGLNDE